MNISIKGLLSLTIVSLTLVACGDEKKFADKPVVAQQPAETKPTPEVAAEDSNPTAPAGDYNYQSTPDTIAQQRASQCTAQGGRWDGQNCQYSGPQPSGGGSSPGYTPGYATGSSSPGSAYAIGSLIGNVIGSLPPPGSCGC